jgi:hypothetical protein
MPEHPPEQPPSSLSAPPMSTTSLPVDARPSSPVMRVMPPVLASDMLREELAPIAPARRSIRIGLGTFAAVFALAAIASRVGLVPRTAGVFEGSLATATLAGLAALLPAPYAARASLAAVAGLAPLVLGARGLGPLAAIGHEGALRAGTGLVLVTALPGALLFRARYRAFRAARLILALVLATCVPALYFVTLGVLDSDAAFLARASEAAVLVATLTAFFGFMGEETTGGCGRSAAAVLILHSARLASVEWTPARGTEAFHYGTFGYVFAAAGELAAGALVAFAFFQLLAAVLATRARKVDVHRIAGGSAPDLDPSD